METGQETLAPSLETNSLTKSSPADHLSAEAGDHLTGGGQDKKTSSGGGDLQPPQPPPPSMGGGGSAPSSGGPLPPPKSGGGEGAQSPLTETSEILVGSQTNASEPSADQSPEKASGGGGLVLPALTGVPFTTADMPLETLDTSDYMFKMRAKKAQAMHQKINKVVQTKIGYLVGIGNEIAQIHATIDTAAAQHVAGLAQCQGTLASHIGASRAAVYRESEAATGRVKGIIDAERGAIRAKAGSVRGTIRSATSSMKKAMESAHSGAVSTMEADYATAGESVRLGTAGYQAGVKQRLSDAKARLSLPGKNALLSCVNYRLSKSLGESFTDDAPLFAVLAELEKQYSKKLSDAYRGNLGKLEVLTSTGDDSADKAKRSGYNQLRSFEKSAQASLDETETKVLGQIDAATQAAATSLDAVEQERSRSIQLAAQQTAADAGTLKKATESAMWSHAHGQGESLVAAADAASAPLEKKPSQKTVASALTMLEMVPLDIDSSTAIGQRMVFQWSMGHASVQAQLDGTAGNAASLWTQDAVKRVSVAEEKSAQSVQATSQGSQQGLGETAQDIAKQIKLNKRDAVSRLKEQATTIGKNLIEDAGRFVEGLNQNQALDTSKLDALDATIEAAKVKVAGEFDGRARNAYDAMIDVPGVFDCTDETKLFASLKGIGLYGGGALAQTYSGLGRNLYSDIASECTDEEYKICKAYLSGNDAGGAALEISYHSSRFYGVDEESLKSLLKSLTKKELAAVKLEPGWDEIESTLYKDLEGDTLNLRVIQSLIAGNKSRAEALELINKITEARWDEDLDALRDAIGGIPAKNRKDILVQFAVLQQLASRSGGLDAVDFTQEEVDADLNDEMGQDALDENGDPITVINDDLTERNLSKGEKNFGAWASQEDIHDDTLMTSFGGPGFTDVALTTMLLTAASPLTGPANIAMAYELERSGASNDRSLSNNAQDLIKNQATYGTTSLQGRAAGLNYEVNEGESTEKAYKTLNYDQKDKDGKITNSAFHSDKERSGAHAQWRGKLDEVYTGMYGTSVQSDINKGDFSDTEKDLLQETREGGQGSAETMIDYAQDGAGTNEWSAYAAFEDAPQELIKSYFKKNPDARRRLLSEFSGDELEKMMLLMLGKIETDKQRWEASKIRWDFTRGSGAGNLNTIIGGAMGPGGYFLTTPGAPKLSANLFWDLVSDSGRVMDLSYQKLQKMIQDRGGEAKAFDDNGMLITLDGAEHGSATDQQIAFRRQEGNLSFAEEKYHRSQDSLTDLISTVAGIVVGAAITIFTAGAAAPVVVTLMSGLTTMATKAALKGARYGVEEMALDAGVLGVEVVTAGLASKVSKAAKVADAKKIGGVVPVSSADFAKHKLPTHVALGIKAGESFVAESGKTLMNEDTYQKGVNDGILKAFQDGLKGAGTAYVGHSSKKLSANITGGIEKKLDIKASWARQSLKVAEGGLDKYMSGQTNLLISDIITGESQFTKKQLTLAEHAILAMASQAITAKEDREAGDLKQQLEQDPDNADLKRKLKDVEDRLKKRQPYANALKAAYEK